MKTIPSITVSTLVLFQSVLGQDFNSVAGGPIAGWFWGIQDWLLEEKEPSVDYGIIGVTGRLSTQGYPLYQQGDPKSRLLVAVDLIRSQVHVDFYHMQDDPKVKERMEAWREKFGNEEDLLSFVRKQFPQDFRNPYLLHLVESGRKFEKDLAERWGYFESIKKSHYKGVIDNRIKETVEGTRRRMQDIEIGVEIMDRRLDLIEPADDVVATIRKQVADLRDSMKDKREILAGFEEKITEAELVVVEQFLDQYEKVAAKRDGPSPADNVRLQIGRRLRPKFHATRVKAVHARLDALDKVWADKKATNTLDRFEAYLKRLEDSVREGKMDRARLERQIGQSHLDRQFEALPPNAFPDRQKALRERDAALRTSLKTENASSKTERSAPQAEDSGTPEWFVSEWNLSELERKRSTLYGITSQLSRGPRREGADPEIFQWVDRMDAAGAKLLDAAKLEPGAWQQRTGADLAELTRRVAHIHQWKEGVDALRKNDRKGADGKFANSYKREEPQSVSPVEMVREKFREAIDKETASRLAELTKMAEQHDPQTLKAALAIHKMCGQNTFLNRLFEPAQLTLLAMNHQSELLADPRLNSDDPVEKLEGTEAVRLRRESFDRLLSGNDTTYLTETLLKDIDLTPAISRIRCNAYFATRALSLMTLSDSVPPDRYDAVCTCLADKMFAILVETKGHFTMGLVDARYREVLGECQRSVGKP